jgi:predicted O-methyltransferase YrrM
MIDKKLRERILALNVMQPRMFYGSLTDPNNRTQGLLDLIAQNIKPEMVILEVGSFAGVSSELFAIHCDTLYCVDSWANSEEYEANTMGLAESLFDILVANHDNIRKIKDSSENASALFEDEFFDMVYIDADHAYDSVKSDIKYWFPKVKQGGFIAGHDFWLDGVLRAVHEMQQPFKMYSDSSWIIKK